MSSKTTDQAIVASLLRHSVDKVFGIPGAHTYSLLDALNGFSNPQRFVTARHEQTAAIEIKVEPGSEVSPRPILHPYR